MKHLVSNRSRTRGFTLVEMALGIALSLGIAGSLIGLIQQQISFSVALSQFSFLRDEAPQVNTLLTNIVNKADSYRIYGSLSNATTQSSATQSDGTALRLRFRNPNGTTDEAIVAFETRNEELQLNYYFKDGSSSSWPSSPTWTISKQPTGVTFDNSSGILLITLRGQTGDEITYAGNPD